MKPQTTDSKTPKDRVRNRYPQANYHNPFFEAREAHHRGGRTPQMRGFTVVHTTPPPFRRRRLSSFRFCFIHFSPAPPPPLSTIRCLPCLLALLPTPPSRWIRWTRVCPPCPTANSYTPRSFAWSTQYPPWNSATRAWTHTLSRKKGMGPPPPPRNRLLSSPRHCRPRKSQPRQLWTHSTRRAREKRFYSKEPRLS